MTIATECTCDKDDIEAHLCPKYEELWWVDGSEYVENNTCTCCTYCTQQCAEAI